MPGKGQDILVCSFPMQALFLSCLSIFQLPTFEESQGRVCPWWSEEKGTKSSFAGMCFYLRVTPQVVPGLELVSSTLAPAHVPGSLGGTTGQPMPERSPETRPSPDLRGCFLLCAQLRAGSAVWPADPGPFGWKMCQPAGDLASCVPDSSSQPPPAAPCLHQWPFAIPALRDAPLGSGLCPASPLRPPGFSSMRQNFMEEEKELFFFLSFPLSRSAGCFGGVFSHLPGF